MTKVYLIPLLVYVLVSAACESEKHTDQENSNFAVSNLVAWCIVPFDRMERGPVERAEMLKELGITRLAYDWRQQHLPTFEEELQALKDHNITLQAVWFWIEKDTIGYLGADNERLLTKMAENKVQTECWFSFSPEFFQGLSEEEKLNHAIAFIGDFRDRAKAMGCTLGMYNHGDWFGNPYNHLKIIDALGEDHLGMVYNFHHAHDQIDEFPAIMESIQAHLLCINLNGMVKSGNKILVLGQGEEELAMLQTIKDSGYEGPIGIIGHQEDQDVKEVLTQNLAGLAKLHSRLK